VAPPNENVWLRPCLQVSLAWSFPSPCFGRLCLHVAVTLAWLLHHFPSSKSLDCPLSSNYLANWYQESSQVRWRVCHAWLGLGTLSLSLLYLFISYLLLVAFSMRRTLSIPAPQGGVRYGNHWSVYDPVVFAHLQCGINPRTSGRMDCVVIDVNSTPDESAKESSYFHVHGIHL